MSKSLTRNSLLALQRQFKIDNPSAFKMAETAAFNDVLTKIGFNDRATTLLNAQGISTLEDLCTVSPSDIDALMKHLSAWKPMTTMAPTTATPGTTAPVTRAATATVAAAATTTTLAPQEAFMPIFPFLSIRKLKALRIWAQYRIERGENTPLPVGEFDDVQVLKWTTRLAELQEEKRAMKDDDNKPPEELKSFSTWVLWEEAFLTYISRIRSTVSDVPLSYLVRDYEVPSPEVLAVEYDTIDEDIIATFRMYGPAYKADNKRFFDLLKPLVVNGSAWPFIQNFAKGGGKNGRKAFLAIKSQAEGQAAQSTRKAKAYAMIATAKYTGKGRFTFDQYVARHQRAHNELLALNEEVAETKKVTDFVKGISDSRLQVGKAILDSRPDMASNFEECQQFFKTIVEKNKTTADYSSENPSAPDRQIAKLQARIKKLENSKKKPPQKKGGSGKGKPKIHNGYYSAQEYRALTSDEKDQVRKMREEAKKRKASATITINSDDEGEEATREVSSVVTSTTTTDDAAHKVDKTKIVKNAGDQFGRGAHEKVPKKAKKASKEGK